MPVYEKKQPEFVRIIYSGITEKELEELKQTNKDCVDGFFQVPMNSKICLV
jgi:hypothetical protein